MTPAEKTRMLAERVMGWHYWDFSGDYDGPTPMFAQAGEKVWFYGTENYPIRTWQPLTNLSHAGEVLEAMVRKGYEFDAQDCGVGKYKAWFRGNGVRVSTVAPLLATAICHAALLAEGVKEEEL